MIRAFLILYLLLLANPLLGEDAVRTDEGKQIYTKLCVECHGENGEGVEDEYDEPLFGDRTVASLAKLIHRTMPEDDASLCEDEQAELVARYVHETFYSEEARARNQPVRLELARLTTPQYQNSAADLVASFRWEKELGSERGLKAEYFDGRRADRKKRKLERIDPGIHFDFGEGSPLPKEIEAEAFAINWRGSLMAPETGTYEFRISTENGFKFYLNADSDVPLIDGWVSSGKRAEHRASVYLLGGRAYPIALEYFKFKDKSASIELAWTPPHGVESVLPPEYLSPERVPSVMVVTTPFPADDRSMGYVRGTALSKAWHRATTSAAIEVANHVVANLDEFVKGKPEDEGWEKGVKDFAARFVARAFRRDLSDGQRSLYVDRHFDDETKLVDSVKRIVLLALSSPHFLYPDQPGEAGVDAATVASRLALYLRDSLPADRLRKAALGTPEKVRAQAKRMLDHPLTREKLHGFFHHWLHLDGDIDLAKDPELFPGFDPETISEMRRSLNQFLDDVVWSETSDYRELLLADYLYLNDKLATFMGGGGLQGRAFRKVSFDPKARAGVLTHPYLLARFAYHRTTSPIHRGVFVTRNVLGRSLKPPPEAVKFEESRFDPTLTMREKVTELTKDTSCMNCHAMINPLGFSLEHFDAVGRYRFTEKDRPIEVESDYVTHEGVTIPIRGARDVAEHAATDSEAQRGFVQHLFEHLVKQPCNAYGLETLDRLHKGFVSSDYSIKELVVEIVTLAASHQLETSTH